MFLIYFLADWVDARKGVVFQDWPDHFKNTDSDKCESWCCFCKMNSVPDDGFTNIGNMMYARCDACGRIFEYEWEEPEEEKGPLYCSRCHEKDEETVRCELCWRWMCDECLADEPGKDICMDCWEKTPRGRRWVEKQDDWTWCKYCNQMTTKDRMIGERCSSCHNKHLHEKEDAKFDAAKHSLEADANPFPFYDQLKNDIARCKEHNSPIWTQEIHEADLDLARKTGKTPDLLYEKKDSDNVKAMKEEMEKYMNGLQRYLAVDGQTKLVLKDGDGGLIKEHGSPTHWEVRINPDGTRSYNIEFGDPYGMTTMRNPKWQTCDPVVPSPEVQFEPTPSIAPSPEFISPSEYGSPTVEGTTGECERCKQKDDLDQCPKCHRWVCVDCNYDDNSQCCIDCEDKEGLTSDSKRW